MSDEAGTILVGRYELIEQAGRGGMAVVWRARTLGAVGFTRPVAIKRLAPRLTADQEFVAMFVEEARVVSHLQHPNITQIHDFVEDDDGGLFMVLEWVDGVDLGTYVQCHADAYRQTPWHIICAVVIDVLRALSAAHSRLTDEGRPCPVFHRDVTPGNILISLEGYTKLTDFGVARAMDRATVTHPDTFKGKLPYVAPEITRSKPATVRTDIYSVGVVLWESLTGRGLFQAPSEMETIWLINKGRVPSVEEFRKDLPSELVEIVSRAIERDPEERFFDVQEMIQALTGIMVLADEPTPPERISMEVAHVRYALGLSGGRDEHFLKTEAGGPPETA